MPDGIPRLGLVKRACVLGWAVMIVGMTVVRGVGAEAEAVPSFLREIEPILTRLGCNQGACHGKGAGQNGFRLSLRGYAPEWDHRWITEEAGGRRVDFAEPEASMLVTKPLGKVPHEGLVRFEEGSRYHKTLVAWIAARAPGPLPLDQEPDLERLEVLPGDREYAVGDSQALVVKAHWPDGTTRDVTWLTQFFSNDEVTASVDADGLIRARRVGETSIRAHFLGRVAVVRVTVPSTNVVEEWRFGRAQNAVDEAVFARLRALKIPPSPLCDDATFARRSMLDVIGTLPTPEEVEGLVMDRSPDKRERWVEQLLGRREFADYWTLQLADLLQNRRERDHDVRGNKGVRGFHAWLHRQVTEGVGWDRIAREVLTARGDSFENPAVGYFVTVVGEAQPTESEVTDSVAQAFLGTRIGCARCHNHPLEKYTQDDFHRFAAFFSRLHLKRQEPEKGPTELVVASKERVERGRRMDEAFQKLEAAQTRRSAAGEEEEKAARKELEERQGEYARLKREVEELDSRPPRTRQPRTKKEVEARPLDRTTMEWVAGADPRERLAEWVTSTENPLFAEAMVNRLVGHFFGVGLVEPVDDLRASNPPSNPALMALLAVEFRKSGHDLRHVMRLVLNSRTYQLTSKTVPGNEADRRFYSHYRARRLPAEVLADAVMSLTGLSERFEGHPMGVRAIQLPEPATGSYFLSLFGQSERVTACACERKGEVTLPQLLHLQNGPETMRKLGDPEGRIRRLSKKDWPLERAVDELYQVALSRTATASEKGAILPALEGVPREEALRDLAWALINSKEFNFNH